jgi:predicted RNase H-like HicB family nuclease
MRQLTVELIPDLEEGGYTARVPDIPAYGEGETEEEAIADRMRWPHTSKHSVWTRPCPE